MWIVLLTLFIQSAFALEEPHERTKNSVEPPTCAEVFPGILQSPLKAICQGAAAKVTAHGLRLAQTDCRLRYGEDPRANFACIFGTQIQQSIATSDENLSGTLKAQHRLCSLHYPMHTEVDGFLQESCITGIFINDISSIKEEKLSTIKEKIDICSNWTPERSFFGPCTVGLTLRSQTQSARAQLPIASNSNRSCDQYFDHLQFHLGYRSCLNATAIPIGEEKRKSSVTEECQQLISDPSNDNERAACIVGATLRMIDGETHPLAKRFEKCGKNAKVRYEDRDFLACLTAASLLQLMDKPQAMAGCKDVFRITKKNASRNDCLQALAQF